MELSFAVISSGSHRLASELVLAANWGICTQVVSDYSMRTIQVLQALLTPTIAVITVFIAWQQWKTNELKLRLERYDRRLRVYQEVVKLLSEACGDGKALWDPLMKFRAATAEADFLFGPEIRQYLDEIFSRALKLRAASIEYRDYTQTPPPGYDHQKVVKETSEQTTWLYEQFQVAKEKFKKYLDINK